MTTAQLPILIIGAGPAGAFLAQILRKAKLPFRIFEREEKNQVRFQGWGVSLQWTIPVLESALPNDLGDLRKGVSVLGEYDIYKDAGFSAFNGGTAENVINVPGTSTIRCSRTKMKAYLSQHLDVEYGRKCIGYEYVTQGDRTTVLAKFADGTTVQGSLLVAADGVNSHVRDQLVNSLGGEPPQLMIPPKGIISANTTLTARQWRVWETFSPTIWIARGNAGVTILGGTTQLHKLPTEADDDEPIADVYLILTYDDETAAAKTTAESKERHRTYWTQSASQEELKASAVAKSKLQPLHATFQQILADVPVKDFALKPLLFTEFRCPGSLDSDSNSSSSTGAPQRRVTVIGDAAHAMLPLRGEGLNNALLDAATLGSLIVQACKTGEDVKSDGTVKSIFARYEDEMLPRGSRAIDLARQAGVPGADYRQTSAWAGEGERYWGKGLDLFEAASK